MKTIELLEERIAITQTVVQCSIGLSAYENSISRNQQVIMKALIELLSKDKPSIKKP